MAVTSSAPIGRQRAGDLTTGGITGTLLRFTIPMIAGSLLQQCYNIADTIIVGRFIGAEALAAVGSSYTLMVFLTSILIGLAMGGGTIFSLRFGGSRFCLLLLLLRLLIQFWNGCRSRQMSSTRCGTTCGLSTGE